MYLLLFLIEFAIIFFLSRKLSACLSQFFLKFTRSKKITIYLLSFLFLPGVIIHELGHWVVANILFVKTGEIEFIPQIHGDKLKLGSVAVAHTDPIRRFFIGVAPIIIGLLVIAGFYVFLSPRFELQPSWKDILFVYLLFEIGNTMYSSSKDMEGAIGFFAIIGVFMLIYFILSYLLNIHLSFSIFNPLFSPKIQNGFMKMDILLGIIVAIDILVCQVIKLLL